MAGGNFGDRVPAETRGAVSTAMGRLLPEDRFRGAGIRIWAVVNDGKRTRRRTEESGLRKYEVAAEPGSLFGVPLGRERSLPAREVATSA